MKEIIDSIRLIKMYAWEQPFLDNILTMRNKELKEIFKTSLMQSAILVISPSISVLAGFGTFIMMTLSGVELSTSQAFTILSVYSSLQFSISTLSWGIRQIAEAKVGFNRLQEFLELAEYQNPSNIISNKSSNISIELKDCSYSWEVLREAKSKKKKDQEPECEEDVGKFTEVPTLFNLSFTVEQGSLTGVAGLVGSGKSSLISALLGEMKLTEGKNQINGKVALVSQQSWIFNGTVRENILMGSDLDQEWYNHVIDVCAMVRDLQLLEDGDMTEVGERGITLSGGQKQRISLARALYSKADIYLLDDPLSAVDAKVGQHIFQRYIKETLANKTVILVTHGMQYLKSCDSVIYMRNGKIAETGDPLQLLANPDSQLAHMAEYDHKRKSSSEDKKTKEAEAGGLNEEEALQKTRKEEEVSKKSSMRTLLKYFNYSGHPITMALIFTMLVLFIITRMFDRIYLQMWLEQGDGQEDIRKNNASFANMTDHDIRGYINYNPNLWKYQLGYTFLQVGMLLAGFIKGAGLLVKLLQGSKMIHKIMVERVMRSPMAFFDVTPSGWILNRFSKDMDISEKAN